MFISVLEPRPTAESTLEISSVKLTVLRVWCPDSTHTHTHTHTDTYIDIHVRYSTTAQQSKEDTKHMNAFSPRPWNYWTFSSKVPWTLSMQWHTRGGKYDGVLVRLCWCRLCTSLSVIFLSNVFHCATNRLKLCKPVVRISKKWNSEAMEDPCACLDCTDWDVFRTATNSLDEYTEAVTSYISFCEDSCVPSQWVSYNNDKPWFTAKLRQLRLEKEETFRNRDRESRVQIQVKQDSVRC